MYLRIFRILFLYLKEKSRLVSLIISNFSDCLRLRLSVLMWVNVRVGVVIIMFGFFINMGLLNKIYILIFFVNK